MPPIILYIVAVQMYDKKKEKTNPNTHYMLVMHLCIINLRSVTPNGRSASPNGRSVSPNGRSVSRNRHLIQLQREINLIKSKNMPKYKLQEMSSLNGVGKNRVFPKIVTNRQLDTKEFVKNLHRNS